MNNFIKMGRSFFAIGMIALSILCLINGAFIIGRPPGWPAAIPAQRFWADTLAIIVILSAIAVIVSRYGKTASLTIAILILFFSFFLQYIPALYKSTWDNILWNINAYKTLALVGGSLIIAASFPAGKGTSSRTAGSLTVGSKGLVWTGTILVSLFLIICGCSHFKYATFIFDYIPAYIPFHKFWTYFTGVALLAGGIGILIPGTRKLAATLSAIMILGWFILLHIPRVIATPNDPSDRMGVCESLAISGILFVLAALSGRRPQR